VELYFEEVKMADNCEECEHFYKGKKEIRDIGGSVSYIPQYKCKKHHKIVKSVDSWVPFTRTYTCPDFKERLSPKK